MNLNAIMKDNLILVVPDNIKETIINKISRLDALYSYKILGLNQLKKMVCFDYGLDAISFVSKKLNVKPKIAKEYLEALYFISDSSYNSSKLETLKTLKEELIKNNLLKFTDFSSLFKNKSIVVAGFDVISKQTKYFLNKLGVNYQIIENNLSNKVIDSIYKFDTLENEVDAVCYQISMLLNNGIDINKIKIANINSDYYYTINRYFKMYNIPLSTKSNSSLYSVYSVKDFFNYAKTHNLNDSLSYFIEKYSNQKETYSKLVEIANELIVLDEFDSDLLKELLLSKKTETNRYVNAVEIIDVDNMLIDEDEYVFVLSINQGIYPYVYKNDDILSDDAKLQLGIDTSVELNLLAKKSFELLLKKSKNIVLSYKEKSSFTTFTKSYNIETENLSIKTFNKDTLLSYSMLNDKLFLAKNLDKLYKKVDDKNLKILFYNYPLSYKTYSHKFKPFNPEKIKAHIKEKNKRLSYSSVSNYFDCGFRYYLANVLGIDKYEPIMSAKLGTAFHFVLEESYKDGFDFELSFMHAKNDIDDVITKFYFEKFKHVLKDIIAINSKNMGLSQLDKVLNEKEIIIPFKGEITIEFKGIIDKIIYTTKEEQTFLALIDYKTSSPTLNIDLIKYGFSLQLPIYLYLIKNTTEFKDAHVCGIYLQKLLPEKLSAGKDYYTELEKNLKLEGYSNSSLSILSMLDPGFEKSKMIKNMSITKEKRFNKKALVLSSKEMDEVVIQVENKIKEVIKAICTCDFPISPKIYDGKQMSCAFCNFKDVCCFRHEDYVYLKNDDKKVGEQ